MRITDLKNYRISPILYSIKKLSSKLNFKSKISKDSFASLKFNTFSVSAACIKNSKSTLTQSEKSKNNKKSAWIPKKFAQISKLPNLKLFNKHLKILRKKKLKILTLATTTMLWTQSMSQTSIFWTWITTQRDREDFLTRGSKTLRDYRLMDMTLLRRSLQSSRRAETRSLWRGRCVTWTGWGARISQIQCQSILLRRRANTWTRIIFEGQLVVLGKSCLQFWAKAIGHQ